MKSTAVLRGRTPSLVAAMVVAVVTIAPVASASTTTTSTPAPSTMCGVAATNAVRVVTVDAPCTVATHVGASFEIVLRSGWRWGTPLSNAKSVIVSDVTKSSMGVASAVLTATAVGEATVEVAGTIYCAKGKVCPDLAMLWTLKVLVTKSATAALTLHLTSVNIDNTYQVRKGDRVSLSLGAAPKYSWSEPTVSWAGVVQRIAGRAGPSASGLFVARKTGLTRLVATQRPTCGAHCSSKARKFSVVVMVTP